MWFCLLKAGSPFAVLVCVVGDADAFFHGAFAGAEDVAGSVGFRFVLLPEEVAFGTTGIAVKLDVAVDRDVVRPVLVLVLCPFAVVACLVANHLAPRGFGLRVRVDADELVVEAIEITPGAELGEDLLGSCVVRMHEALGLGSDVGVVHADLEGGFDEDRADAIENFAAEVAFGVVLAHAVGHHLLDCALDVGEAGVFFLKLGEHDVLEILVGEDAIGVVHDRNGGALRCLGGSQLGSTTDVSTETGFFLELACVNSSDEGVVVVDNGDGALGKAFFDIGQAWRASKDVVGCGEVRGAVLVDALALEKIVLALLDIGKCICVANTDESDGPLLLVEADLLHDGAIAGTRHF